MGEIIGYARVSSRDQNPDLQIDALKQAGCRRVFVDKASGSSKDRPQLEAALDYIRSDDTLVVWRLDRLGRSLQHLIELVNALGDRKVGFKTLQEGFETTTAGGKLVFHIFGALAEFERELIRERTHAGREAARARGLTGGRNKQQAQIVREMWESRDYTLQQIADTFKVGRTTIHRTLKSVSTG